MAFHQIEMLRIESEFHALAGGGVWDRIEDGLWLRRQREHAAWAAHGQWWRRTALGKHAMAEGARARNERLKAVVVSVRGCEACGKPFPVTASQHQHSRGRVCSAACRGRARQNVKLVHLHGERLPLARWAERYGIALSTVWKRRNEGWSVLKALETPVRRRSAARTGG
ncbi:MAG: hypothetical protein H0X39_00285 [Actinobacteria bacterium]|nr:hypothetical protein [Actinomycetota bacterium]